MIVKGEGIVLRCVSFSNTSQINTVYTPDSGKISIYAKGIRRGKPSRQFPGVLEPCQHIGYVVFQKSSSALANLNEYELKNAYSGIRRDLHRIFSAFYLVEFIYETTLENDACPQLFWLLCEGLECLAQGKPSAPIRLFFQIQSLAMLGYAPRVDICARCRKPLQNAEASFGAKKQVFLCLACKRYISEASIQMRAETLAYLQRIAQMSSYQEVLQEPFPGAGVVRELNSFFRFFLYSVIDKELRTARYFRNL